MHRYGYQYRLNDTFWKGLGFKTREEAADRAQEIVEGWIAPEIEKLNSSIRWFQFWNKKIAVPDVNEIIISYKVE